MCLRAIAFVFGKAIARVKIIEVRHPRIARYFRYDTGGRDGDMTRITTGESQGRCVGQGVLAIHKDKVGGWVQGVHRAFHGQQLLHSLVQIAHLLHLPLLFALTFLQ